MSPAPWDYVYEPSEEALQQFFIPKRFAADALTLELGKVRGTNIPVYLDLNAVAKGHMFVAGMTRSGKSSFLINLVAKASKLKPRPRFVIFDRRGEYGALTNYEAVVFQYDKFTPTITDPDAIVAKLGVKGKEKDAVSSAVQGLIDNNGELTRERILAKCQEILDQGVIYKTADSQAKAYRTIQWCLDNKGDFIENKTESYDVIESIKTNPTLIIDYSVDTDIEKQHRTAQHIINEIRNYAMQRKDEGDFACIVAIEEAQYLAPEKGAELVESDAQKDVKASMIETISQAGGYNVGLIIMTQRPAYVLKGCISQCNSVACFRLKSGNDQDQVLMYTEYGSERLRDYLPGLADHEAMLWGIAIPTPFPVIAEMNVDEYPRKATVFAKQAWERMET
jgi:DNA helicase HerA-like ATPase